MNGAYQSIKTEHGGKLYRIAPAQLAKAQAYWSRKSAQRRQPGNCGRCGNPNPDATHAHCSSCRAYQQRRKSALRIKPVTVDATVLSKLERRIAAMEHNFAMMRINERAVYKRGYLAGKKSMASARYFDAYPTITKQELSSMNHAYASKL